MNDRILSALAVTLFAAPVTLLPPAVTGNVHVPAAREIVARRTMTSRTFLNADGSYTAELHAAPIHYRATDGSWKPIDTSLAASARAGFAAANIRNVLKSYLPAQASGWVRVEREDTAVSFRPMRAASVPSSVTGSIQRFSNAWANTEVRYIVQAGRVKETLTLTAPRAPSSFSYTMRFDGLTPHLKADNTIALKDKSEAMRLVIGAPWMRDARGRSSAALKVSLSPAGSDWVYTLTPDPAWLSNARYPVVIDPWVYSPSGTAVVRKAPAGANTEHAPGVNASGTIAGSYLAAGDPTPDNSDAYRSVAIFDTFDLPLDIEVTSASLEVYLDHALNNNPVTLEARRLSESVGQPGTGSVTWTSVGSGVPPAPAGTLAITQPNVPGQYYIPVTEAMRDWAETREMSPAFLLRDVSDTSGTGSGNVLFFSAGMDDASEETDLAALRVSFREDGWYMFQGNARHTGRTQYPISQAATNRWNVNLGLSYTQSVPDITPSLIAVPRPSGDPSLPVVYAATSDGAYNSRVSRIVDNGDSLPPTVASQRLVSGVIHGTPLLYANVLWVTGNDSQGGFMYALKPGDVTQLAWADSLSHPNPIRFRRVANGITYNSIVYASPVPNPLNNGILVAANVEAEDGVGLNGSGFDGYLFCKSSTTGLDLWSNLTRLYSVDDVDQGATGEPHRPPCLYGAPVTNDTAAFVTTSNAWVNAIRLDNGGPAWSGGPVGLLSLTSGNDHASFGSPIVFQSRLYATSTQDNFQNAGGIGSLEDLGNPTGPGSYWSLISPLFGKMPGNTLTTPAVRAEQYNNPADSATLIFGDDTGKLWGVGSEVNTSAAEPKVTWQDAFGGYGYYQVPLDSNNNEVPIRSSPLVSGTPQGPGLVFFGADDGRIRALDADVGSPVSATIWGFATSAKFRSSMAAYKGRLYALSTDGTLWCFH